MHHISTVRTCFTTIQIGGIGYHLDCISLVSCLKPCLQRSPNPMAPCTAETFHLTYGTASSGGVLPSPCALACCFLPVLTCVTPPNPGISLLLFQLMASKQAEPFSTIKQKKCQKTFLSMRQADPWPPPQTPMNSR